MHFTRAGSQSGRDAVGASPVRLARRKVSETFRHLGGARVGPTVPSVSEGGTTGNSCPRRPPGWAAFEPRPRCHEVEAASEHPTEPIRAPGVRTGAPLVPRRA